VTDLPTVQYCQRRYRLCELRLQCRRDTRFQNQKFGTTFFL